MSVGVCWANREEKQQLPIGRDFKSLPFFLLGLNTMPWSIQKKSDKFCVILDDDGSESGCHDTRAEAVAQIAALNASDKTKMGDDHMYPMWGVTSFAELDELSQVQHTAHEMGELVQQFQMLASNVIEDYEIEDKSGALRTLASEFVDRVEITMSDSDMADKQTGFIASLKNVFKSIPQPETETKDNTGLMLWKDKATGRYRWFAVYSNKYRDDDYPAEIISEKSHKTFAEMAKKGIVPMPELWQWHIPGSRWAIADWVDYTDDGFAVASGLVDEGCEGIAEAYAKDTNPIKVSHGMPKSLLIRSDEDPSIIDFHVTTEISPLPADKAANPYTGFQIHEVKNMSLSQDQRTYLEAHGLNKEGIEQIVQGLTQLGKQAQDDGRESKQANEEAEPKAEQEPAAEDATETAANEELQPEYVTRSDLDALRNEVAEAIGEIVTGTQTIGESVKSLTALVKELQADDRSKIAKAAADTPPASLSALIAKSVVGNDAAQVDGRTSLAKDGPKETEEQKPQGLFFDEWISGGSVAH